VLVGRTFRPDASRVVHISTAVELVRLSPLARAYCRLADKLVLAEIWEACRQVWTRPGELSGSAGRLERSRDVRGEVAVEFVGVGATDGRLVFVKPLAERDSSERGSCDTSSPAMRPLISSGVSTTSRTSRPSPRVAAAIKDGGMWMIGP
jgi:hypothetical protein